MPSRTDIAVEMFTSGYNCAQSVLYAFLDESALDADTALKIACGLGAGMGRKQEVCGAVTGGILVLGLRHGRGSSDERSAMDMTYAKTRDLMDRFAERHGSCICRALLSGCDLSTQAGQRRFREQEMLKNVCAPCVQTVVEILEGLSSAENHAGMALHAASAGVD
ncbi:MAG: C_GCAxxG_C_C family protein [Syntrophaceae bacterium]|nr:C_GCAxxG_C_C family protein [Syntrophaceae bacterium]